MGYAVLGVAVDGALLSGEEAARSLAIVGATIEMVTHGLITGSLLLLSGSVWQHGHEYESGTFGGLSGRAPALAAFATLAAIALLGVLVTAALFLQRLQRLSLRAVDPALPGG